MPESKDVVAAAEAVKGIVEAVPIYQDAVQPAAKEIGKALSTIAKTVNVALAPIGALVWGYERICEYLDTKLASNLASTPPADIQTPPPNIAGPALEALRFTGEAETLRELYATLLASAMDRTTTHLAHPAFVEIIKQLSVDEARIMKALSDGVNRPVIDVMAAEPERSGERVVTRNQSMLDYVDGVQRRDLVSGYLDNLCRLGLTEIPAGIRIANADAYGPLESEVPIKNLIEQIEAAGYTARIERHLIRLTDLGQLFVRACVIEHDSARHLPSTP